jgi:hypothetical protein
MRYLNLTKQIAALALASALFSSCDKEDEIVVLGDKGTTIVKILEGGTPASKLWSVDFVNAPSTLLAIDLRRDIPNETELNKSVTVVIKDDTAAVRALDPTLVQMPTAFYTIGSGTPKVGGQGGTYTITFAPGEIAKEIYITIPNATLMSTSSTYGLGFTIQSSTGGRVSDVAKTLIYKIGAKNAYDGVYECAFSNYHPTLNAGYTGDVTEVQMITTGANSVKIYWPDAGGFACPAILSGGFSYFGAQEPEYTVNPANNAVTVQNAFVGATTFYTMNSTHPNNYTPATKVMDVRWGYSYVAGAFVVGTSREWTQKFTYLRSR